MTTNQHMIPLDQLTSWKGNVRKTARREGLDELCASIAAHGLLQALVVARQEDGTYAVVAGERRLLALQALAKRGVIAADAEVACSVRQPADDLTEVSLAENVVRIAMHPADQFEAFAKLASGGMSASQIAERFGSTEDTVLKRLKLGRLSPKILRAYRNGEIGLEQAQAFTLTDDRKTQERVLESLSEYNRRPDVIRRALTEGEIPSSDKRVRFVGIAAVAEAGGAIRRDLFDAEDSGYVQDAALLDRLVASKLSAAADAVRLEGWKWVEIRPDLSYEERNACRRAFPDKVKLPKKQAAILCNLAAQYDRLSERLEVNEHDQRASAALEKVQARIESIEAMTVKWSSKTLSKAGAFVTIDHDGSLGIERGFIRHEDQPKSKKAKMAVEASGPSLPTSLVSDLTAQKSAAIAVELARKPDIALAAVVHALISELVCQDTWHTCLKLSAKQADLAAHLTYADASPAHLALQAERERWGGILPGDPEALWPWCLRQTREQLLELLAFAAAWTLDAVTCKSSCPSRNAHADLLAQALEVDMTDWFTPAADNYFVRTNRSQIAADYKEAKGTEPAPAWLKLKKTEFAQLASKAVAGTRWLPQPIRIPEAATPSEPLREAAE